VARLDLAKVVALIEQGHKRVAAIADHPYREITTENHVRRTAMLWLASVTSQQPMLRGEVVACGVGRPTFLSSGEVNQARWRS
jgi:hypothetical protein